MWVDYVIAFGAILVMLVAWIAVQRFARWYALRHPELGPPREEGGGCGGHCLCKGGAGCKRT
jgi:hypothetical protein